MFRIEDASYGGGSRPAERKTRVVIYAFMLAIAYLWLWRAVLPPLFVDGTAWAEVGTDFLPTAYTQPVTSGLCKPDSGYLALFARFVSLLPALCHVPIAVAPLFVQHLCTCWQILCLVAFVHPCFRLLVKSDAARALICLALMLHPDAELKTVINSAYWAFIPFVLLAWADAVAPTPSVVLRGWLGIVGVVLALSKAQMVALAPYACVRAWQTQKESSVKATAHWAALLAACAWQISVALRHVPEVRGALWDGQEGPFAWLSFSVWRLLRYVVRACFGDGMCQSLKELHPLLLLALLMAFTVVGVCASKLNRRGDAVARHVLWSVPLIAVPATVLVAKMPVVMAGFAARPCGFVAYRGLLMPAVLSFLGAILLLTRAIEWPLNARPLRAAAIGVLVWLAFFSQPFGGVSWLLFPDAFPARPPYLAMCRERSLWPASGYDRWLALFAMQSAKGNGPCIVPVNPSPFAWHHGCGVLPGADTLDAALSEAQTSSRKKRWKVPASAEHAAVAMFAIAAHSGRDVLRASLFDAHGQLLSRVWSLPALSKRDEDLAFFVCAQPTSHVAFVEIDAGEEVVADVTVRLRENNPQWRFFGTLATSQQQ